MPSPDCLFLGQHESINTDKSGPSFSFLYDRDIKYDLIALTKLLARIGVSESSGRGKQTEMLLQEYFFPPLSSHPGMDWSVTTQACRELSSAGCSDLGVKAIGAR